MNCPYCLNENFKYSYMNSTFFNSKKFDYLKCKECKVIYVHPFPDESDYLKMYPPSYQGEELKSEKLTYDDLFSKIKKYKPTPGKFLDYGCGYGDLIFQAQSLGYQSFGIEYNEAYIPFLKNRNPLIDFFSIKEFEKLDHKYDIIVLNNVLEHVTNPNELLQNLKSKLISGGVLVVTGPMEDNFTLAQIFRRLFFLVKNIISSKNSNHPPYHITFTNHKNQLEIFNKNGYKNLLFETSEVSWPFPDKISFKSIGMFFKSLIAVTSLKFSPLLNKRSGNVFLYIGKKN